MVPLQKSTGFRCGSCFARSGGAHLLNCQRDKRFDPFSTAENGLHAIELFRPRVRDVEPMAEYATK
jgi:hypothetical protein